jgi:hypothetical protein
MKYIKIIDISILSVKRDFDFIYLLIDKNFIINFAC